MALNIFDTIRRKPRSGQATKTGDQRGAASSATLPIRLSGTVPSTESDGPRPSTGLGDDNPNGRTGNDWTYPDWPRGRFDVDTVNGDRLQDFANTHLSEGPAPGRIPRGWNNRIQGKVGRNLTGNPAGDNSFADTTSGQQGGGIADMKYVPHTPTPRGGMIARPYLRTVDDYAPIPGVYVADATRR